VYVNRVVATVATTRGQGLGSHPATAPPVAPAPLLAAVSESIGEAFPLHAAGLLGEPETRVRLAFHHLLLPLLHRIARRADTMEGASRLFTALANPQIEADVLATVSRLVADRGTGSPSATAAGETSARAHFGRRAGSVIRQAVLASGLRQEAVTELLGLMTPLVYAALKEQVSARGLDAQGLRALLADGLVPLSGVIRRPARKQIIADAAYGAAEHAAALLGRAAASARRPRRAVALAGLVVALVVAGALAWRVHHRETPARSAAHAEAFRYIELPGGRHLDVARGGVIDSLATFLSAEPPQGEHVLLLDEVRFKRGTAFLESGSQAQLTQIAKVVAAFPSARIEIGVAPDADGDRRAARKLAESRALAVRAALVALGVRPSQMSHVATEDAGPGGAPPQGVVIRATRR
jgi:outer membrane protein OmpA-like peptidoglycan-associated protein/protein-disulfide isomerase-like protein with CxxC motif